MITYRRTSLFSLYPIVDFSFSAYGSIYTLKQRIVSRRSDKVTLVIQKKGTRNSIKRHFKYKELYTTFVFLQDNPRTSLQPKSSICLTYTTI